MGRLASSSPTPPATQGIEEDVRSHFRGLGVGEITMDNAQVSSHVTMVQYTERRDALLARIEAHKEADPLQRGPFWQEEFHDAFARIVTGERMIERCREVQRMHWLFTEGRDEEAMRIHDVIQERMRRRRQEVEEMEMEDERFDEEEESEAEESDDEEESDASDSEDPENSDDDSQEDSEDVYNDHLEDSDASIVFEDPEDGYNGLPRSGDDNLLDFDASDSEDDCSAGRRRGVEEEDSDDASQDLYEASDIENAYEYSEFCDDDDLKDMDFGGLESSDGEVLEDYDGAAGRGRRFFKSGVSDSEGVYTDSDDGHLEDSEVNNSEEDVYNEQSEDCDSEAEDFEMVGYEQSPEFQYMDLEEDIEDFEMVDYNEDEQSSGFEVHQEDYEMVGYPENQHFENFEVPEFENEQFEMVHYNQQQEEEDTDEDEEIDVVN
ncbi:hypothetical protein L5515_005406 [Caenorhabditis briggsae]|uniref:Uncharacterized protein n=1 Tax=Caenorhabditis briggsae TaxID=6238 RepID=A0AAE9ENC8_CAEBR|nr:hypothetical protein L5515_005406 [Caenorhabditis briggsae]